MAEDNPNVAALKKTYERWQSCKGLDTSCWDEIMADHIRLRSVAEETPGLQFAKDRVSKQEMAAYFSALTDAWEMVHWTPETYVADGDCVAMFGRCAWKFKATGKTADVRAAHLVRFENGKIAEFTEIFDSARAAAATMG
ncbi:MAG: nuclear transport factor 2 family protein [Beijerinckiaceae bacterium]